MKIAIGQINPTVGDLENNFKLLVKNIELAYEANAEVIIFPELALIGYPPKDLILKHGLVEAQNKYIEQLAIYSDSNSKKPLKIILGAITKNHSFGKKFYNSLLILDNGHIAKSVHKSLLPSYDVFDETRYFENSKSALENVFEINEIKFGLSICEDIWIEAYPSLYNKDPIIDIIGAGAELLINIAASPYSFGKAERRKKLMSNLVKRHQIPLVYVNQVGANDQLVFDGNSLVFDSEGSCVHEAKPFQEDCYVFDLEDLYIKKTSNHKIFSHISSSVSLPSSLEEVKSVDMKELKSALILGLRDYIRKCNFQKVVLGLSGGIDSALVATLAVQALGSKNVIAVMMPSKHTSKASLEDAKALAFNLELDYRIISIEKLHEEMKSLVPQITDLAEENLQARLRANILLTISNSESALLLSTSNKSELAVGYSTLYGDSCGGIALIGDLLKSCVYKLSRYLNEEAEKELIPENIFKKDPSAELRPEQKDQDTLPPYEILDQIVLLYVQEMKSLSEIVDFGFDKDLVGRILNMIDRNEYKRQQSAPVIKLAGKAFGLGRRMPIAQGYKHR